MSIVQSITLTCDSCGEEESTAEGTDLSGYAFTRLPDGWISLQISTSDCVAPPSVETQLDWMESIDAQRAAEYVDIITQYLPRLSISAHLCAECAETKSWNDLFKEWRTEELEKPKSISLSVVPSLEFSPKSENQSKPIRSAATPFYLVNSDPPDKTRD